MGWKLVTEFNVDGIPKAQPRHRSRSVLSDKSLSQAVLMSRVQDVLPQLRAAIQTHSYNPTSEALAAWRSAVIDAASSHLPQTGMMTGPVRVDIDWYHPRPQRLCRKSDPPGPVWHIVKADRDNLDKAVLDAMGTIMFWRDDCQVCAGEIRKFYHEKGGKPGATIRVSRLEEEPADEPLLEGASNE